MKTMIAEMVRRRIETLNRELPAEDHQSTAHDAQLFGGRFDSLSLVGLLVGLESDFCETYGHEPKLMGNPDVIVEGGPLETVGSLIRYLEGKVDG
jgi:hypothetical protein